MKRSRTNVSRELKERITLESLEPGCDLVSLAKKYNLSSCTVDKWRRHYQKQQLITLHCKYRAYDCGINALAIE